MIRFIFVALFLILYLICSIPIFLGRMDHRKDQPTARDISSLRIVQWGIQTDPFHYRRGSNRDR